jgi:hypothetical protein
MPDMKKRKIFKEGLRGLKLAGYFKECEKTHLVDILLLKVKTYPYYKCRTWEQITIASTMSFTSRYFQTFFKLRISVFLLLLLYTITSQDKRKLLKLISYAHFSVKYWSDNK